MPIRRPLTKRPRATRRRRIPGPRRTRPTRLLTQQRSAAGRGSATGRDDRAGASGGNRTTGRSRRDPRSGMPQRNGWRTSPRDLPRAGRRAAVHSDRPHGRSTSDCTTCGPCGPGCVGRLPRSRASGGGFRRRGRRRRARGSGGCRELRRARGCPGRVAAGPARRRRGAHCHPGGNGESRCWRCRGDHVRHRRRAAHDRHCPSVPADREWGDRGRYARSGSSRVAARAGRPPRRCNESRGAETACSRAGPERTARESGTRLLRRVGGRRCRRCFIALLCDRGDTAALRLPLHLRSRTAAEQRPHGRTRRRSDHASRIAARTHSDRPEEEDPPSASRVFEGTVLF